MTLGLAGGALTFFVGNRLLEHFGAADRKCTGLVTVLGFAGSFLFSVM